MFLQPVYIENCLSIFFFTFITKNITGKIYLIYKYHSRKFIIFKFYQFLHKIYILLRIIQSQQMGCAPQPKKPEQLRSQLSGNIQQIFSSYKDFKKYQQLSQKDCYEALRRQIDSLPNREINYESFMKMFPILSNYPEQTSNKFFMIFSQNQKFLSKKNLLIAIIIFQQAPSRIIQRIIFYLYCSNSTKQLDNRFMKSKQLAKFSKENKEFKFIKQNEKMKVQKRQLQYLINHQNNISLSEFTEYFKKYYCIKYYRELLQWNLEWKQKQLAAKISKLSPIGFKIQDPVYVVQYQWFLSWKYYMKDKYQSEIQFQRLLNTETSLEKSVLKRQSSINSTFRPTQIKNNILQGFFSNTLKRGLKQFRDYVFLPEQIWQQIYFLYSGGPVFKRSYPEIYSMTVIQVYVNQFGYFKPNLKNQAIHFSENRKEKYKIKKLFQRDKYYIDNKIDLSSVVCYIKPEGKLQWMLITSLQEDLTNFLTRHRTYICFVPKNVKNTFQNQYNCIIENKKKKIVNRIANYGSRIKITINNTIQQAYVIDIPNKELVVIDHEGNYEKKIVKISALKDLNPSILQQQETQQNSPAGLDNLGNTCYINSVIQCLLAIPSFGEYLQKQYSKVQEQNCIMSEVYHIFEKNRKAKNTIDTSNLKKKIDKFFPYFIGYSPQDAQEFLINLLTRMEEEINFQQKFKPNVSFEQSLSKLKFQRTQSISQSLIFDLRLKKRETIQYATQQDKFRYFAGMMQIETVCTKCNNKGKVQNENFFAYSISLPQHIQKQYYFIFVPKLQSKIQNWSPRQYGFTAPKNITFSDSINNMSKVLGISKSKLFAIPVTNGQWRTQFYEMKQLNQFLNFGIKVVCYEVQCAQSPDIQQYYCSQWEGKTAKIQVRQRFYQKRAKTYTSFYIPLLLEVSQKTQWSNVTEYLDSVLEQDNVSLYTQKDNGNTRLDGQKQVEFRNFQSFLSFRDGNEKLLNSQSVKIKKNQLQANSNSDKRIKSVVNLQIMQSDEHDPQKKKNSLLKRYYKIRLIKKDNYSDNSCFICSKKFKHANNDQSELRRKQQKCNDCIIKSQLINDEKFIKDIKKAAFVIDWQQNMVATIQMEQDASYAACLQRTKNRKDNIKSLLQTQIQSREEIQLKCSVETCFSNNAYRMEKITKYPNIFILHLKRFRYVDGGLLKLTNPIVYQQQFTINGEMYELFGVILHSGIESAGGHYKAYVKNSDKWYKCDDQRVQLAKANEIINPQTYLIFYKKVSFSPTLLKVHF